MDSSKENAPGIDTEQEDADKGTEVDAKAAASQSSAEGDGGEEKAVQEGTDKGTEVDAKAATSQSSAEVEGGEEKVDEAAPPDNAVEEEAASDKTKEVGESPSIDWGADISESDY